MPRKYKPVVKTEYSYRDSTWDEHYARMEEDRYGQWVPLKVFEDEQARLNAMILKLKKQLNKSYNT
jgi:hypothetical protein